MSAEIRVSYRPDNEWLGQLDASVTSGAFSGKGSAWFDQQQSVTARFLTEYAATAVFASHLEAVLNGTRETAVVRGVSE